MKIDVQKIEPWYGGVIVSYSITRDKHLYKKYVDYMVSKDTIKNFDEISENRQYITSLAVIAYPEEFK